MADYILHLTYDEFEELYRCLRVMEQEEYINLLCHTRTRDREAAKGRNRLQNQIKGKFMDVKRKRKEIVRL